MIPAGRFTLYVLATLMFILGLFDLPKFGTARCISAGLALMTLAPLVPLR